MACYEIFDKYIYLRFFHKGNINFLPKKSLTFASTLANLPLLNFR